MSLQLDDVSVMRGDFVLCAGVNVCLQQGDICHVVGENGLGKTTLLHQIVGILPTNKGTITTSDKPPLAVLHQTGIHENLSVSDNLLFLANLYTQTPTSADITSALTAVDLVYYANTKVNQLSAGQYKRVGLSRLFLPFALAMDLWVLDEPFTALDGAMIARLEQQMSHFASKGGVIILTSHQRVDVANIRLNLADFVD